MDSLQDFDAPHNQLEYECHSVARGVGCCVPRRGVSWVLRWTAAVVVFWFATSVLVQFAYSLAAEHMLTRAARAAVREATLPRATCRSVRDTVERHLAGRPPRVEQLKLAVYKNEAAVGGALRTVGGDRMSVTVAVPCSAVMPRWLNALGFWTSDSQIEVRAERDVPGRLL